MTIDFKNLGVTTDNVTIEIVRENFSIELSGTFTMTKGSFQQEIAYWAKLVDHRIKGYVHIDDYEYESYKSKIGDVEIDNTSKFHKMLTESGLESLSNKLTFTDDQKKEAMFNVIYNHKMFIYNYGVDIIIWNTLTEKEKTYITLKFVIDTYNERVEYDKRQFFPKIQETPSLEKLSHYYDNFDNMYV